MPFSTENDLEKWIQYTQQIENLWGNITIWKQNGPKRSNVFKGELRNVKIKHNLPIEMAQTASAPVNPVPNLALQSIIRPALAALANEGKSRNDLKLSIQQLIKAFNVAEDAIPGISQEILAGILRADGYSMNINEILLRCSHTDNDDFQIERKEPEFVKLEKKANELKAILGRIPEEIQDRSKFLQTIKDIASAIKELLDSVNQVLKTYQDQGRIKEYRKTLEQDKREFVKYSKSFSDTLKQYFKDMKQDSVFLSANCLINQTNNILIVFRMVGRN